MSDSGYSDGPWSTGFDWGSSTVDAVLQERTDQRDALKQRLDELRAEIESERSHSDSMVGRYYGGYLLALIDKPLGGAAE